MLRQAQQAVFEFHKKNGYTIDHSLSSEAQAGGAEVNIYIHNLSLQLKSFATDALVPGLNSIRAGDSRLFRTHLMLEELAELLEAMAQGDEVETADALADIIYVAIGSGVSLGIPLGPVFNEVHHSNMTKGYVIRQDGSGRRDKGPDYKPPQIAKVLEDARNAVLRNT